MEAGASTESGTRAARPTLAAVARVAGVSASTASLAFSGAGPVSEATRTRVLDAAAQLGYAGPDPRAQSLRRGRSGIVGVVMEDRLRDAFRDPMNIAMLDGVSDALGSAGAGLLLLTDRGGTVADISVAPMDAVILIGCSTRLDQSVTVLQQRGLPVVAIEGEELDGVLGIDLDNREASARAARHLWDLGHRHIAVVTLPFDSSYATGILTPEWEARGTAHTARERLLGVRDVFADLTAFVAGGSAIEAGREAGFALLGDAASRPTAVIAQSDLLAVGVIRAAGELGLTVPDDLSVVGFDGVRLDEDAHDLTTLVQPAVDKGRAAGRAVIELLAGGHPERVQFTSEFHLGSTTAPPRDAARVG